MTSHFYGRSHELGLLNDLVQKKTASLAVIKGRRRVGKSRLIEEFAKGHCFCKLEGLAPRKGTTAQTQREQFSKQLTKYFNVPVKADDWWDLLWFLADKTKRGKTIILLDEISWMGNLDPDFLGKLKAIWDNHFKKNPKLILILCGSVSTWIDKNILSSTGFAGRLSLSLTLKELPLDVCNKFWGANAQKISAYEKFKLLAVTGGIPRYLEEIKPKLSAEENIRRMCFESSGILFKEFDQIFSNALMTEAKSYKQIALYLAERGFADRKAIASAAKLEIGGVISDYLENLVEAGFVARDYTWHIRNGNISKLSHYRLKDNYLRFYLKYILPNKAKIEKGIFEKKSITGLSGWDTIMGFQFENLVISNHENIVKLIGLRAEDVIFANPFFQKKTARQLGCQIDYLIQTKFNTIYVCEIKFSRFEITPTVIKEVSDKILKLKLPRYFSYRPVLIHVNGVREDVEDSEYFAEIIDFSKILENG
jgi:uncharacterized protein